MNAAIIGCGLIGKKRAEGMKGNSNLIGCFDTSIKASQDFAEKHSCKSYLNLDFLLQNSEIDYVVIATQHSALMPIAIRAIETGKHVFLEKPGALVSRDLQRIANLAVEKERKIHVGYNHKFHPSLMKMFEMIKDGAIGKFMYLRGRYGHGGRIGYENEWRANKQDSGGGELIDQGSHLLDISLEVLGNLKLDYAATPTYFWDMQVEDNAFMILSNKSDRVAFLHASCTEWKNKFSLEVYGTLGKLEIPGIGRSYGLEKLIHYRMMPEMGPPVIQEWIFREEDISWRLELEQFVFDLENGTDFSNNIVSSVRVLEIVEEIYRKTGR